VEFTISKSELVRELNLSQGVVEKKTTIPILSNVLFEADGDRIVLTATDWSSVSAAVARPRWQSREQARFPRRSCSTTCDCCPTRRSAQVR
jgi:hypothetical protein